MQDFPFTLKLYINSIYPTLLKYNTSIAYTKSCHHTTLLRKRFRLIIVYTPRESLYTQKAQSAMGES